MTILITGGSGFIGFNFIKLWQSKNNEKIINIDKKKYSITKKRNLSNNLNLITYNINVTNTKKISKILKKYNPRLIIHFAAESHVDKSLNKPSFFIKNNCYDSSKFLNLIFNYWQNNEIINKNKFRFINISTDEVYGHLNPKDPPFNERTNINPRNPYSVSKSSFDLLCNSYFYAYNFPVITTHCTNNFGKYQSKDKLIPLVIKKAINFKKIPVYGDGQQIRDWLFVKDHCLAILKIIKKGIPGNKYNIGSNNEIKNIDLVILICKILDKLIYKKKVKNFEELITFVKDRPGHDQRYSIDSTKIKKELNWESKSNFKKSLISTIKWYIKNY